MGVPVCAGAPVVAVGRSGGPRCAREMGKSGEARHFGGGGAMRGLPLHAAGRGGMEVQWWVLLPPPPPRAGWGCFCCVCSRGDRSCSVAVWRRAVAGGGWGGEGLLCARTGGVRPRNWGARGEGAPAACAALCLRQGRALRGEGRPLNPVPACSQRGAALPACVCWRGIVLGGGRLCVCCGGSGAARLQRGERPPSVCACPVRERWWSLCACRGGQSQGIRPCVPRLSLYVS